MSLLTAMANGHAHRSVPKLATVCECTQLQVVDSDVPVAQIRGEHASHAPGTWGLLRQPQSPRSIRDFLKGDHITLISQSALPDWVLLRHTSAAHMTVTEGFPQVAGVQTLCSLTRLPPTARYQDFHGWGEGVAFFMPSLCPSLSFKASFCSNLNQR